MTRRTRRRRLKSALRKVRADRRGQLTRSERQILKGKYTAICRFLTNEIRKRLQAYLPSEPDSVAQRVYRPPPALLEFTLDPSSPNEQPQALSTALNDHGERVPTPD